MSELNVESLDDPLVFDGAPSFRGGTVSNERANLLQLDQSALMVNCDINRFGKLTTRRGTAALGGTVSTATTIQGLINFQTPTYNYLVAFNNGKPWQFDGASTWTQMGTHAFANTTTPFCYAMGIDQLYMCDGIDHLWMWDGTTLSDQDGTNSNLDPPRGISLMEWFTGRLCVVAGSNDTLYFSNFLKANAGQWNRVTQSFRVGEGEGDPITGIKGWSDFNLIVFKQHSIYVVNCNPNQAGTGDIDLMVSNFNVQAIHKKIGCLAPLTAVQVGSDVYFLANDGVRTIKRTAAAELQSEISEPISYPIQDIIDRINRPYIGKSCATFKDNRYLISVPLDSSTVPNYTLVYNVILQSWSGYWTGWTPTVYARRVPDAGPSRTVFGQSNGTVSEWLDYVALADEVTATFQDRGSVNIPTTLLSRAFTFNDLFAPKTGYLIELEFAGSLATQVSVFYLLNGSATPIIFPDGIIDTTTGPGLVLPFRLPGLLTAIGIVKRSFDLMPLNQFREIQFQVFSGSAKVSLRTASLSAFVDSYMSQAPAAQSAVAANK
jgi:hypothetical protein